jgi:hypothetical protein
MCKYKNKKNIKKSFVLFCWLEIKLYLCTRKTERLLLTGGVVFLAQKKKSLFERFS